MSNDHSDQDQQRVFKASASGVSGNIALMIFFLSVAVAVVGICWAGAWLLVNLQ